MPDAWVAAGFVRNCVWDALHGYERATPLNDIDVVFFDSHDVSRERDAYLESRLHQAAPGCRFSVKNQARMHLRNHHAPYASSDDALQRWPETCTAVGVAAVGSQVAVLAPFGLDDLFSLRVRATSDDPAMRDLVRRRAEEKRWQELWPLLVIDT